MIQNEFANTLMPKVAELISGRTASFYDTSAEENLETSAGYFMAPNPSGTLYRIDPETADDIPENTIAVLKLSGVVMKNDFCGMGGTASMRSNLISALSFPNVVGSLIVTDSPGGAVNGSFELSQAIAAAKKPVFGFADGLAASAAYLILCGCTEIFASHASAVIGSVGVMTTLRDYSEQLKSYGVTEHTFTARTSPDKNKKYLEAMAGDDTKLQETDLIPLHKLFQDAITTSRPDVAAEALTGDTYLAEKAMSLGLIDGIASYEDVLARAMDVGAYYNAKNPILI